MSKNDELLKMAYKAIEETKDKVNSDYFRLKYHLMPPVGFMNDPNGFINFDGVYHLFYQFNPFYTKGKKVYWGHFKSTDLVNWEEMPIALSPSNWYETHGCYSGSAVNDNGILTLMYTGNVKNSIGERETYQCIAVSRDGINFDKYEKNPVIHNQPEGYTRHFRDPKVWKHNDLWYMVIGTQTVKEEGGALLYSSSDLLTWSEVGEVAGSNLYGLGYFGYMWECPNLFNISGRDILLFCPQGLEAQGDLYNNIYQCGYVTGELDYSSGKLTHGAFVELDRGFEFYAPQVTVDEKGRTLLISWMGLPDEENSPTIDKGWLHIMTIPRELSIKEDKIYQRPVEEMKLLRKAEVSHSMVELENSEIKLDKINGDSYELKCEASFEELSQFGLKLRCSQDEEEQTLLYYDIAEEKLVLDRNKSGVCCSGIRKCHIDNKNKLKLHIFVDTSSIEVFVNEGEETFTARIYPKEESKDIIFFSKGGKVKFNVEFWEI